MSTETRTCEHGRILGKSDLEGIAWAGPVGHCRCCLSDFGYIDSGEYTQGYSKTITHDRHLCRPCGGKQVVTESRLTSKAL